MKNDATINLRLPKTHKLLLEAEAARQGRSLCSLVRRCLEEKHPMWVPGDLAAIAKTIKPMKLP